jgi:integrase/recombinase XerD
VNQVKQRRKLDLGPEDRRSVVPLQVVSGGSTEVDQAVRDFLTSRKAKGVSRVTLRMYTGILETILLPFCRREGLETIDQLDSRQMDRLRTNLLEGTGPSGKPLRRSSVNTYCRQIAYFLNWLRDEELVERPIKIQREPQVSRREDILSDDEIERLLAACDSRRDRLIIMLLADTGMRVSELTTLRFNCIVYGTKRSPGYLKVLPKGARGGDGGVKERVIPVKPKLLRELAAYISDTGGRGPSQDRVFISKRRDVVAKDYIQLESNGLRQMLRNVADRAGIERPVYPHMFRHTFITKLMAQDMNPLIAMRIVGHTSMETLRGYAHLTQEDDAAALMRVFEQDEASWR